MSKINNNKKSINCPGLIIAAKPTLTVSCIEEVPSMTKGQCVVCGKETTNSDIHVDNIDIHSLCVEKLECSLCHGRVGKRYVIENGNILHKKCREKVYSKRCFICAGSLENSNVYEWNGLSFHEECFTCSSCHRKIETREMIHECDGLPLCPTCYSHKEKSCLRCNEVINTSEKIQKFLSNGKAFYLHSCCALCYECRQELTKDNFVFVQNKAICRQCWARSLSHECQECHEPVLSNDIMEYHGCWHNECIKCKKCQQSMKYLGVKIDIDQMFCPECLKGLMKHCGVCGEIIDSEPIFKHQRMFHHCCFRCSVCNSYIGQSNSEYLYGKLYCSSCLPNEKK